MSIKPCRPLRLGPELRSRSGLPMRPPAHRDGTPTVNGVALPPSSSVTFIPGQTLQIQPPANFTHLITITPSLQQDFTFRNTLGLDFEILGDFQALEGDIQILGQDLGPFGPVYEDGPNALLDPQKLFSYSWSFDVAPPASVLPNFNISIPQGDLAVTLVSEPPPEIDYSIINPTPQANYTVTVTNNGPLDATGVVLADLLPSQIQFGSAAPALPTSVVNQARLRRWSSPSETCPRDNPKTSPSMESPTRAQAEPSPAHSAYPPTSATWISRTIL